jgi:hypothetical protein
VAFGSKREPAGARRLSSWDVIRTAFALFTDLPRLLSLMFRSHAQLAAENLFLRKQLACHVEREVRPRRTDNASRIALVLLSHFVDWRELLTIVRQDTLVRWHRGFLVHDRDGIFAPAVDEALRSMSLQVLKTPGAHRKRTHTVNVSLGLPDASVWIG